MTVELKVSIEEVEPGGAVKTYCAESAIDHLPENNIKGYGRTPEEALEAWVEEIREREVFRPD